MLPLFRKQLHVVIYPDRVILRGLGKGIRRTVVLQKKLPCQPKPDAPNWQSALSTFEYWLASSEMKEADVTIILSNHFVRYSLIPNSTEVNSHDEAQTLAKILFEDIYGLVAKKWEFAIEDGVNGESRLIAAIDSDFLIKIVEIIKICSMRLSTITPYFVSAFNRFNRQIPNCSCFFALVEHDLMMLATFNKSTLTSIRRFALNSVHDPQFSTVLLREVLTSGLAMENVPVYLQVIDQPNFKLPDVDGVTIHLLQNPSMTEEHNPFDMVFPWK